MPAFAASADRITTVVRADEKTGRLVRSIVVEPRAVAPITPGPANEASASGAGLFEMVDRIAAEQGVESSLVRSVILAESNYQPRAVSPKGALGMMQLIPATARRFGVADVFDPEQNVQGGVRYLKFLLDYYDGDYAKAIAAYNAGEGAVDKYKGIPPFPETRDYVYRVANNLKTARRRKAAESLKAIDTVSVAETHNPVRTSVGSDGRVYFRTP